jgi:peroxiredoxin/putative methionine-R-sulfoxide reductase with GAF domain
VSDAVSLVTLIETLVAADAPRDVKAKRVADAIRRHGSYRWIGIYDIDAHEVAIVAWAGPGPPAHPRFPVTEGVTSAAIATAQPVVVNDVEADPRYLDALGDTRAEMIVPVLIGDGYAVRGTIDVESNRRNAFSNADRALLAASAAAAAPLWAAPISLGDLELPEDLPAPVDDGACAHLRGAALPDLTLQSSHGPINLAEFASDRAVLYIYPRTGKPGRRTPPAWDAIPGARGCTPESCTFRDHAAELAALGFGVAGLSSQTLDDQIEFAERNDMPYPVIADPERKLGAALELPKFAFDGATLYKRVTLIAEHGVVTKVFYPVFPPDHAAEEVLTWLRRQ